MGKEVVFLAAMEILAEQFPGAFSDYSLQLKCQISKLAKVSPYKVQPSC
uniref:Uncharacterized protein n=1 Tax=Nelumbo nucifera TaxID=4432 RepID=A0A822XND5_NELNU|nr:TPA_asm: hypothetical protein HUJ06_022676 [Nelumbo nucifera]